MGLNSIKLTPIRKLQLRLNQLSWHILPNRGIALSLLIKEVGGEVPLLPLFFRVRASANISIFQLNYLRELNPPH